MVYDKQWKNYREGESFDFKYNKTRYTIKTYHNNTKSRYEGELRNDLFNGLGKNKIVNLRSVLFL